jgi:hypothetical protein
MLAPEAGPARAPCTVAAFHLPRENSRSVNRPTEVPDTNTAQNTPVCCQPRWIASQPP